jgi:hypothetical protein
MNARNTLFAVTISLVAGTALAAGADGPSFPSMAASAAMQADEVVLPRAHVQAQAAQGTRSRGELFAAPDGETNETDNMPAATGRSRAEVRAELLGSERTRQVVGATTLG